MNTKEIKEKFSKCFSARPEIRFAYLFGSQAKNETGRLSDIDIAAYLDEKIDSNKRFDLRLKLIGQTCRMFKTDNIDLIVLNNTPLLLSFMVIYEGVILCSRDEKNA
ncbi:MAG: nucleotidyltransferase domain-containing protein [Candidatus Omnitrophota bacterium]